ncbi:TraR/DksA family transcriptional regulator [Nocardioides acrostichi]|uniref:TraR/DksA C4-type zinc finger protein n=1 Tax=Nocardioides acrostichi TaxID=2784339 RepID=A0A930UZR7_9ACTN|nr:TraR/DksA C4-type zinc finger protein [Nocardioides acrostichi]MBF4161236.1 TraR/DksA C4-type zinc finger protein [Nocardioides acrostichi]
MHRRLAGLRADLDAIAEAREAANVDDEHDPEGATIAFERAQAAAVAAQLERRASALEEALTRLDAGTYGTCERCGEPIPAARLEVRPAAATCVGCATPHG